MNTLTPEQQKEIDEAMNEWSAYHLDRTEVPIVISPYLSQSAAPTPPVLRYEQLQGKNLGGLFERVSI
jgi:hypothetical protein